MFRRTAVTLAAATALGVVGCGSSDDETKGREASATPAQARAEIGAVRTGLDRALETYRGGDREKAAAQVGDLYLQHFEDVEGPLEKVDSELKEQLETGIATTIRDRMKQGETVSAVAKVIAGVQSQLDRAETKLR